MWLFQKWEHLQQLFVVLFGSVCLKVVNIRGCEFRTTKTPVWQPYSKCIDRFTDLPVYRFTDSPIYRSTDSPIHRFSDLPIHRFTGSPIDRLTTLPASLYDSPYASLSAYLSLSLSLILPYHNSVNAAFSLIFHEKSLVSSVTLSTIHNHSESTSAFCIFVCLFINSFPDFSS